MSSLNLNDIRIFLLVAELNSFSAAASYLKINKSNVSRRITALEESMGIRLIERGTKGIMLTNGGKRLVTKYQSLFQQLAIAEQDIYEDKHNLNGNIQVSLPINLSSVLGDLLSSFSLQYPQVSLDCELVGPSDRFGVKDFDVAFLVSRSVLPEGDYIARELASVRCGLFASPDFLSRYPDITQVEQLKNVPCLCTSHSQQYFFSDDNKTHSVAVSGNFYIDNSTVLLKAALKGLGIIRLPEFAAKEHVAEGRLKSLKLNMPSQDYQLFIAYKERTLLPLRVRTFIDFFLELRASNWPQQGYKFPLTNE